MDTIDRHLLRLLQTDARRSNAELADLVGLSNSACAKRVARFWSSGLISRLVARLDRRRFARPVSAAVMVTLSLPKANVSDQFAADMLARDEVQQCHAVTGDFDYLLIVTERSIEDYHAFAQATFGTMPTVQAYKTVFLLKTVKNEDSIPDFCLNEATG